MKTWMELLTERHNRYYASDGRRLHLSPPMPLTAIKDFQQTTGYTWTSEFFDLYTHHDGVGTFLPNENVLWEFVPTVGLNAFGDSIRDWFAKTHTHIAEKFHPFFDWGSGDALGYLEIDEIPTGTLVEFEHEYYEFDAAQSWRDFLKPTHDSIRSFLEI